jgi:hypothetical protein
MALVSLCDIQEVESCSERLSLRDQEILHHLTNLRDLVSTLLTKKVRKYGGDTDQTLQIHRRRKLPAFRFSEPTNCVPFSFF